MGVKFSHAIHPWEIQPRETPQAFEAWSIYRDLGLDRSYAKVAKALKKSEHLISRWGKRWGWQRRVELWHRHLDRLKIEEMEKLSREAGKRHLNQSLMMQKHLIERLQSITASDLTVEDVRRWIETAVKVERLSLGMTTDKIEHTIPDEDDGFLDISDPETVKLASSLTARIINQQKVSGAEQPSGAGVGS